jgi:hypothetical protein
MQIDVSGPRELLDGLVLRLRDVFVNRGYAIGPRLGMMDAGNLVTFVKDDVIISVQVVEEESGECNLHLESEADVPGVEEIWDDALISLGREYRERIRGFAKNVNRVEQEISK